jgi:SAM-dependent methyltransferase
VATSNADLDEYTGAEEYDRENGTSGPDLDYYLDLARATGGPGLDLACGTGFLTIPFAEAGLAMTGVDRAPEMLELARRKTGGLPIRWVEADLLTLDLGEQFRLVTLTGNAFQEFLTLDDQEGLLGAARRHLAPDGLFAFETRFPKPSALLSADTPPGEWSAETPWRKFTDEQGRNVTVSTAQRNDLLRQTVDYVIHRRWQEDGRDEVRSESTTLRFVYPREMEALLRYNGFTIRDAYGDWDRSPLSNASSRMIYVCGLSRES